MYFSERKSGGGRTELKHLKSIDYWHRPGGGLIEVIKKMKAQGVTDPTELDKSYIELYIASLLGFGLQESEGRDFWIAKPQDDPPDMAFMTIIKDGKGRIYFHSREIEITRYLNNGLTLLETILKKDKNYPGDYILACFLETSGIEDLQSLSTKITPELKNINHVFLVFHGLPLDKLKVMTTTEVRAFVTVVQIAPVFSAQIINIEKSIEKWISDNQRLIYVEGAEVFYGLRPGEDNYPQIIQSIS